MRKLFFFLFLFISVPPYGQNLILNPDFEEYENDGELDRAKHWKRVGTPDYYNMKAKDLRQVPMSPICRAKYLPFSGDACMMFRNYGELIIGKCIPLIKDHKYKLEVRVRRQKFRGPTSTFWIWLDTLIVPKPINHFLDVPAQFHNHPDSFIFKTRKWQKFSTEFIAKGGEKYIAIGGKSRVTVSPDGIFPANNQWPWIFVDNLSLIDITPDFYVGKKGKPIRLKNIHFGFDRAELLPPSFAELDSLAEYLLKKRRLKLQVMGHTDAIGSKKWNQKLSEARAKAVKEYLVRKGVVESRITFVGFGSSKPLSDNKTKQGRQLNRRVEVLLEQMD